MTTEMWAAYVKRGTTWTRVGLDHEREPLVRFLADCFPNRPSKVELIRVDEPTWPRGRSSFSL